MIGRGLSRALTAGVAGAAATLFVRFAPPALCERGADAWLDGSSDLQTAMADDLVRFERRDDEARKAPSESRFAGEWALVTHQMVALALAQIVWGHPDRPELGARYRDTISRAAVKSFLPEMRDFGTRAWDGEDALASLDGDHGHAYLAYAALAVGVARTFDATLPADVVRAHDALVGAYERRLLASPTGLIETYPGEAYPTDVAAVAATIAVHGRATGARHDAVLAHWVERVRAVQIDRATGFVIQRMGARDGARHDVPRGSGTGLAAYFAGFADRGVADLLTAGLARNEGRFAGFGAIREYGAGQTGSGDIDSGPVIFGVSVAATGFALAPFRATGRRDDFRALYRTTNLFGLPLDDGGRLRFATGGPIGNALLCAFLTSGPERR